MVRGRTTTIEALKGARDVGKARLEKYAARMLPVLEQLFSENAKNKEAETASETTDGEKE